MTDGSRRREEDDAAFVVELDPSAFTDLVLERKTALGLAVGGRVEGDGLSNQMFCAWDPVLRSASTVARSTVPAMSPPRRATVASLDLDRRFRLDDDPADAAHFLAEAGFILLDERVHRRRDGGARRRPRRRRSRARALTTERRGGPRRGAASATRAASWTSRPSPSTSVDLMADRRFLSIGQILDDGHEPGDPFGEHFHEVTAEGLLKRVGSVEGLVCLPWHKDCERGGHSMFCSGLTIGICVTPVDEAHGGLDVIAGSHRAHIAAHPGRSRARLAGGDVAGRARRPDRARVLRPASFDAPGEGRTAGRLHGLRASPRRGDEVEHVDHGVLAESAPSLRPGEQRAFFQSAPSKSQHSS